MRREEQLDIESRLIMMKISVLSSLRLLTIDEMQLFFGITWNVGTVGTCRGHPREEDIRLSEISLSVLEVENTSKWYILLIEPN